MNGKVFFDFSNEWKKVFHTVENFYGTAGVMSSGFR